MVVVVVLVVLAAALVVVTVVVILVVSAMWGYAYVESVELLPTVINKSIK